MVNIILRAGFLGLLFILTANATNAQGSRWDNVTSLQSGTRLVVDQDGRKALKGRFASATADALFITSGGRQTEVPRASVAAVYLGKKGSRTKRALIGALAGAGAGMLIGAAAVAATKSDPLIAAGGFLYGLPVGAVIGAATGGGTRRGDLIYSR